MVQALWEKYFFCFISGILFPLVGSLMMILYVLCWMSYNWIPTFILEESNFLFIS